MLHKALEKGAETELTDEELNEYIEDAIRVSGSLAGGGEDVVMKGLLNSLSADIRLAAGDLSIIYKLLYMSDPAKLRDYIRRVMSGTDEYALALEVFGEEIATKMRNRSQILFGQYMKDMKTNQIVQLYENPPALLNCPFCENQAYMVEIISYERLSIVIKQEEQELVQKERSRSYWANCVDVNCWAHLDMDIICDRSIVADVQDAADRWNDRRYIINKAMKEDEVSYAGRHAEDKQVISAISYHTLHALLVVWGSFIERWGKRDEYNELVTFMSGSSHEVFSTAGAALRGVINTNPEEYQDITNQVLDEINVNFAAYEKKEKHG